jgi:hypothetical protein
LRNGIALHFRPANADLSLGKSKYNQRVKIRNLKNN